MLKRCDHDKCNLNILIAVYGPNNNEVWGIGVWHDYPLTFKFSQVSKHVTGLDQWSRGRVRVLYLSEEGEDKRCRDCCKNCRVENSLGARRISHMGRRECFKAHFGDVNLLSQGNVSQ